MDLLSVFKDFLQEEGITFRNPESESRFLDIVIEEVEVRIGHEITLGCTEEDIKVFDSLRDSEEIRKWLDKYAPDLEKMIAEQVWKMKEEIKKNKSIIMRSAS